VPRSIGCSPTTPPLGQGSIEPRGARVDAGKRREMTGRFGAGVTTVQRTILIAAGVLIATAYLVSRVVD
jgi:hypothetical protein